MSHTAIADAAAAVAIQPGAVVSKVIYRDENVNVNVTGFDVSEGLTEHQAARAAIVQVLSGRMRFTADGEERSDHNRACLVDADRSRFSSAINASVRPSPRCQVRWQSACSTP